MGVDVSSRYRGMTPIDAPDASGVPRPSIPARLSASARPGALDASAAQSSPRLGQSGTPYFHVVVAGETIELLAQRFLGSSQAWWQIADANPGVFPGTLRAGTTVVIPTQVDVGRVVRSRTF